LNQRSTVKKNQIGLGVGLNNFFQRISDFDMMVASRRVRSEKKSRHFLNQRSTVKKNQLGLGVGFNNFFQRISDFACLSQKNLRLCWQSSPVARKKWPSFFELILSRDADLQLSLEQTFFGASMFIEYTLIFALGLIFWTLILALRVIELRSGVFSRMLRLGEFQTSADKLERAIRAHGNACEYIPLFLLLMLILEFNLASELYLFLAGIIFLIGRLMHGVHMTFYELNSFLRTLSMVLTFVGYLLLFLAAIELIFELG
jgi:uncharacterized membrane protein YecN with MAPEG domain